jgi:hypothetical protein
MEILDANISLINTPAENAALKSVYELEEFQSLVDWKKRYVKQLEEYHALLDDCLR